MVKVFIDPGHGGYDSGAVHKNLIEKNMNLITALACKRVLEKHGVIVEMSRTTDKYISINDRCRLANLSKSDYFISIHYNAGGGDGVEAIHSIYYGKGTELANKVVQRIHLYNGQNFRPNPTFSKKGKYGTDYYGVIRMTRMSAIIVEGAFIDSNDNLICDTIMEQEKFGIAIGYGILDQLKIKIIPETTVPSTTPIYGFVTAKSGLRVRYGPSTNYSIATGLKYNTKVQLLKLQNDWWSIVVPANISKTGIGYVHSYYIKKG